MSETAVRRVVTCVGCKGENVAGSWRAEGWYGYCLTCALRFWHRRSE